MGGRLFGEASELIYRHHYTGSLDDSVNILALRQAQALGRFPGEDRHDFTWTGKRQTGKPIGKKVVS